MSRTIRHPDIKLLWYRSGGRCAICRKELSVETSGGVIGQMAHIIAASSGGPRADSSVPAPKLNKYENLILLCPNHHTEIDSDTAKWTHTRLRQVKRRHEEWVRSSLTARLANGSAVAATKCLFVLSGPPGVGKDVISHRLIHALESQGKAAASLRRYTTRSLRPGEVAGIPFTYLSQDEFGKRVKTGEIGCVHTSLGHTYGCDSEFAPETPKGCAILHSMRVYSALPMMKKEAESKGLNVRNILLVADAESLRCRVLMRSTSEAERSARIDQALGDLAWLENNRDGVESFFDLALDNSDTSKLRDVTRRTCEFINTTLLEISELAQHLRSRTTAWS